MPQVPPGRCSTQATLGAEVCSKDTNSASVDEAGTAGASALETPAVRKTSRRHSRPGRDHCERERPLVRWKARNSSRRSTLNSATVNPYASNPYASSQRLSRATCRSWFTVVRCV